MKPRFALVVLAVGLGLAAALLVADRAQPGGRALIKVVGVDEVAYYATAHSLLFDRDLDLANQYARLRTDPSLGAEWFALVPETGRPRSSFPLGVSLLFLPFLAAGQLVDLATGGVGDGYSRACMGACFVGVIVFTCLGLLATERLLRAAGTAAGAAPEAAARWAGIVTLLLLPGTTVLYYSYMLLSQTASFFATALFFLAYWRARGTTSLARWAAAGAAAGFMTLCRWQDLLFVAMPVADELFQRIRRFEPEEGWPRWSKSRAAAAGGALAAFLPQLLAWKSIFGRYVAKTHEADFFAFPPPHLLDVLFSSQNGWFTWTPLTLLGIAGLLLAAARRHVVAVAVLAPIVLQWVLLSSLPDIWHGGFFGIRNLTSCASLVGVGLLWLVLTVGARARLAILGVAALCGVYTVVFAAQYRLELIPRRDRLTVQEMLWDKVQIRRVLQRRQAEKAGAARLDSDPEGAAQSLEAAIEALGPDRRLLQLLVKARERAGDVEGRRRAEDALQRVLDSRLF